MKLYIPKNRKIVSKQQSTKLIIEFEKKIYDDYNLGKIPYPIHLSKGTKNNW